MMSATQSIAVTSRRWRRRTLTLAVLKATSVVLPLIAGALTALRLEAPGAAVALALGSLVAGIVSWRRWRPGRIDLETMARHLDRTAPQLEESSELLLAPAEDLALLGRLQRERIVRRLAEVESELAPPPLGRSFIWMLLSLGVALLVPLAAVRSVEAFGDRSTGAPLAPGPSEPARLEPAVAAVEVRIAPPAYTGRSERTISGLDLTAEAGAEVEWRVEVVGDVVTAALVFDESETLPLTRSKEGAFRVARRAAENHLYRLELTTSDGAVVRGGYARFTVTPDELPEYTIVTPQRFVELAPGRGQQVEIVVEAGDDYGLGPAALIATVASGFGELVEFRERRLTFDRRENSPDGSRRYSSRLDLDELGVAPGSEFFFFAQGEDRRSPEPQVGRSATHIVRLPGDRTQSVGLASRLPILRVPEFFRSQRQIILDTERLLSEEVAVTAAEFRRRSEGLGFDQRALRQRYGGLLGEEFDAGRGGGGDLDDEAREEDEALRRLDEMEPGGGGGREAVREALETLTQGLAHQHDSADTATYFDSEIKAQLKAALEEMWGAEGKLRSLDPKRALPFEYRALTLLKQVQQRSRLYVQKIGFEAPVLYPEEKRLTGDLKDIRTRRREGSARADGDLSGVKQVLELLRAVPGADGAPAPGELDLSELAITRPAVLAGARSAARRLAEQARLDPELELDGLENLRRWITSLEDGYRASPEVVAGAVAALWGLLPTPEPAPVRAQPGVTELNTIYRGRLSSEGRP